MELHLLNPPFIFISEQKFSGKDCNNSKPTIKTTTLHCIKNVMEMSK